MPADTCVGAAAWDEAMAADEWPGPPVWLHGDLLEGNLLVDRGRLTGCRRPARCAGAEWSSPAGGP
ncbi:phosphotransferase [Micromonospora luteifusca]|uniref:phosphotransferase n=1 Tax=Micromonospora luteifusca TaxID=709860 RepID=UPI0035593020